MSHLKVIKSAAELSSALGDDFILFVGSAVSGVSYPRLAMVNEVVNGIIESLSSKFTGDSYVQQLYAQYSQALVSGSYKNLLSHTKFEEFLWLVTKASNRTALNDLLNHLYTCEDDEYGPNHKAIAALIRSGRCRACFTTNFDNAIELACPELMVYDEPGVYPSRLPNKGERPVLIKLHGSSPSGNCVAESVEILTALSEASHHDIRHLLHAQKVFVVGYSGWGDIDISLHLNETKGEFFWANHSVAANPPDWASTLVLSNLRTVPDADPPNLLLELAGIILDPYEVFREHPSAALILHKWCEKTDVNAEELIESLFEWRRAWPILHIYHEEPLTDSPVVRSRKYGWACIQLRAYETALKVFSDVLVSSPMATEDEFHIALGKGFALWRLGRLNEARETLGELADNAINELATASISDHQLMGLLSNVLRNYLEVSRDVLQWLPPKKRTQASKEWKLDIISDSLESLPRRSLGGWLLNRLVILHIKWLQGENVTVKEVRELYDNAYNSNLFNIASAIVSLLLQMSPREGFKAWRVVHQELKATGIKHYVRKDYQSLVGVVGATRLVRPFGKLIIRAFGYCRTWTQERKYQINLKKWSRWRKEWITSGKVITVEE